MDQTHTNPPQGIDRGHSSPLAPLSYTGPEADHKRELQGSEAVLQNYLIVYNPKSGSSRCEELRHIAQEKAAHYDKRVHFLEMSEDADFAAVLGEALSANIDALVAAGGDGTVAAVASEAMRHGLPLGLVPSGTANLFARELGVALGLSEALDQLFRAASVRKVDLILIEDKFYTCHLSMGVYSLITQTTDSTAKKRWGRFAYLVSGLNLLRGHRLARFDMEIDGRHSSRRASTLMITNVGVMGAGELRWSQEAAIDDGCIEICVIRAKTLRHYFGLLLSYLLRRPHPKLQENLLVRNYAKIRGPKHSTVTGDGEEIARGSIEFSVEHQVLSVITG